MAELFFNFIKGHISVFDHIVKIANLLRQRAIRGQQTGNLI